MGLFIVLMTVYFKREIREERNKKLHSESLCAVRSLFSPFSASFYAFLIKRIKKEFRSVRLRLQWDGGKAGWAD
jgi:hypothetical protein